MVRYLYKDENLIKRRAVGDETRKRAVVCHNSKQTNTTRCSKKRIYIFLQAYSPQSMLTQGANIL